MTSTYYATKEDYKKEVERLYHCQIALSSTFLRFCAETNRADGATITENFSGKIFFEAALKELAEMEDIIKRYRTNQLQKFQEDSV